MITNMVIAQIEITHIFKELGLDCLVEVGLPSIRR